MPVYKPSATDRGVVSFKIATVKSRKHSMYYCDIASGLPNGKNLGDYKGGWSETISISIGNAPAYPITDDPIFSYAPPDAGDERGMPLLVSSTSAPVILEQRPVMYLDAYGSPGDVNYQLGTSYHYIEDTTDTQYVNYVRTVKAYASCLGVIPVLLALTVAASACGNSGNAATARAGRRTRKTPETLDLDAFAALIMPQIK